MKCFEKLICATAVVIAMSAVNAQDDLLSLKRQYSEATIEKVKLNGEVFSMYHQLYPQRSKEYKELYKKKEDARKYIKVAERKFIEKTPEGKALYTEVDELDKGIKRDLEANDYEKRRAKITRRDALKVQIQEKIMESLMSRTIDMDLVKANQNYSKCSDELTEYEYDQIKKQPVAKRLVKKYEALNKKIAAIRKKGLELVAAQKKKIEK